MDLTGRRRPLIAAEKLHLLSTNLLDSLQGASINTLTGVKLGALQKDDARPPEAHAKSDYGWTYLE